MNRKRVILFVFGLMSLLMLSAGIYFILSSSGLLSRIRKENNKNPTLVSPEKTYKIGDVVDTYNGVKVYYNGPVSNVTGRNKTPDGYNLGLKYQCVEFVKRYYYEYFKHKMPNSMGHAKDFYNKSLPDGGFNADRNLYQYKNYGSTQPKVNDLLIWNGNVANPYGHVAIISAVEKDEVEIVQQNPGSRAPSREKLPLIHYQGKWKIAGYGILGWLRKQ